MKICHFTSVHPWNDTRVFYKECCSLAAKGYEVSFVVPNGTSSKVKGVNIISTNSKKRGKYARILFTTYEVYKEAKKVDAKIYHFHDPELFLAGLLFRMSGKKVVFDIHENIVEQIKKKEWGFIFKPIFIPLALIVNKIASKHFKLILAESSYADIYQKSNADFTTVLNYPDFDSFKEFRNLQRNGKNGIFYLGAISKARNIDNILKALNILDKKGLSFHFHCVGPFVGNLENEIRQTQDYINIKDKITFYGRLDLYEGYKIADKCKVGLAVLKPIGNYIKSYPTKIFEYMSIGLPVITSNFELYKKVIEKHDCGFCVEPESPADIAKAIEAIFNDNELSLKIAQKGLDTIRDHFNWKNEEIKLFDFYERIIHS